MKMATETCGHHSVQTDSHRPKVAVFDKGIQVGVPRHHEFDVDSSPMSSDPVASDDEVRLAATFVDDSAQALDYLLVLNTLCRSHFSGAKIGVVGSVPFGSIFSMMRVPPHTAEEIGSAFADHMSHQSAATDNVFTVRVPATTDAALASVSRYVEPTPPVTFSEPVPVIEHVTPPKKKMEECVEDTTQIIDVPAHHILEEPVEVWLQERISDIISDQTIDVSLPQILEEHVEIVESVRFIPQERVQQQIAEHPVEASAVDVPDRPLSTILR